jgi:hypothetical protein
MGTTAPHGNKVTVDLDAQIVDRVRTELCAGAQSDAAVVESALNAYLLGRLLDDTQTGAGLSDDGAERLIYEELHVARRERAQA